MEKFVIVISDCHLSAGRIFEGKHNPYEDFHFDREMVEMFDHFSTGPYGSVDGKDVEVELVIAGDFLDFLNVAKHEDFDDAITEDLSVYKLEQILKGHVSVVAALKRFASRPGKKITYLIGNHDADLFWPKVQEKIVRAWDAEGRYPSPNVKVVANTDRLRFGKNVEVRHGNQFEAVHVLNFERPWLDSHLDKPVLNLPWGSFYVLKIINRLKTERDYIDKVRPIKVYAILGLLSDTFFTLRFLFLSAFYFLKTRFVYSPKRRSTLKVTAEILRQETDFLLDLEKQARQVLDEDKELKTLILGHTHKPMNRVYPDGKQYINTGTWTKMINLDWRNLGKHLSLTFAYVKINGDSSECELRTWVGESSPHRPFYS